MKVRASAALWVCLSIFFLVHLVLAIRPHVIIWDEAVYLGMGKYIYSLGSVGLWEILRPIGLPLILGAVWRTSNSLVIAELIMMLFAAGLVVITYLLGRELADERVGIVSGLIVLATPVFFLYTGYFLSDIPSAFFMMVSILFMCKRQYSAAGLTAALAFLTRFPHGLLIVGTIAAMMTASHYRTPIKRFMTSFMIPSVLFLLFNYIMYYKDADVIDAIFRPFIYAAPHQGNILAGEGGFLFYVIELAMDNPLLLFVPAGIFFYIKHKLYHDVRWNTIVFSLLVYLAYHSIIPNKQLRFGLAFLGVLAVLAGLGSVRIYDTLQKQRLYLLTYIGVFLMITSTLAVPLSQQESYTRWRSVDEPALVTEFYRYVQDSSSGRVLTSDPVPAAYTDALFIPYYFSVQEGLTIVRDSLATGKVQYIIYTPRSFVCGTDYSCTRQRDELVSQFSSYPVVFQKSYAGDEYVIYSIKPE